MLPCSYLRIHQGLRWLHPVAGEGKIRSQACDYHETTAKYRITRVSLKTINRSIVVVGPKIKSPGVKSHLEKCMRLPRRIPFADDTAQLE